MRAGTLARVVLAGAFRSPKEFALSSLGIVVGIAAFVLFVALALGVRKVIVKVFPLEQVEVAAPLTTFVGKNTSKQIGDEVVASIRARPEVAWALPRMAVGFPAGVTGSFGSAQLPGFPMIADGIDPSFLADDKDLADLFRDWETPEHIGPACVPPGPDAPASRNPCPNPERQYCDPTDQMCHYRVPGVLSQTVLELYNTIANSNGLPVIGSAERLALRSQLGRARFVVWLGTSVVGGNNVQVGSRQRYVEGMVIGISPKAMQLGATVPIQYVQRWNREFLNEQAGSTYSSVMVSLKSREQVAPFAQWVDDGLGLRLVDSLGKDFATAVFLIGALFVAISVIILSIAAINISHSLFLQVSERRRELGLYRALGAKRLDVRLMILGEAGLLGFVGGGVGVAAARGLGWLGDWAARSFLPNFPHKPDSFFAFEPWIFALGLGIAVVFCVVGGFLPARAASKLAPAVALSQP
ncbi:MAG: ABC transporter permease [Myxococcales bacterium]|nr:ABC transporter permease [Myxococcales bacterium]